MQQDDLSKEEVNEYLDLYLVISKDCLKNHKKLPFSIIPHRKALEAMRKIVKDQVTPHDQ